MSGLRRRTGGRGGTLRRLVVVGLVSAGLAACEPAADPPSSAETRAAGAAAQQTPAPATPLPSWNDGPTRDRIVSFVEVVTDPDGDAFVPVAERVAVFDNDGTLWSEKPLYFQLLYAIDFVKAHADAHPEWKGRQPFEAVLQDDQKALAASGTKGILELVMASHAGMTTTQFDESVRAYLATAKHPTKKRRYPELVFQPMLELLAYLRDNGFSTWIVTGGGVEFVRTFSEAVYGVPPEQVVGSSIEVVFEMRDDGPVLRRQPKIHFVDDKGGKPVGIHRFIGRRPIAAFGNSDGDLEMLQWTAAGDGARLLLLVHHTDAEREWAYDRDSVVGKLDAALDEARTRGWLVADMKRDWKVVYPFEESGR
jgi:phosphoserine phosphatase